MESWQIGANEGGQDDIVDCEPGQWRLSSTQPDLVELPTELEGQEPFRLPCEIFDQLYPYQKAGVAWMARLWQSRKGGLLADEMGLGKTVQVCALLNGARKAGATHALLLLPVTLLDQWAREARKWCPGWPVHIYHGSMSQRTAALRRVQRPKGGLLLTSYSLVSGTEDLFDIHVDDCPSPRGKGKCRAKGRGKGRGQAALGQPSAAKRMRYDDDEGEDYAVPLEAEEAMEAEIPECGLPQSGTRKAWDVVVCDEAHKMKNMSTLLGKVLRRLQSDCRVLLTGTPVQNALQDLWSLMDFAQPGLLGNHATFVKTFSEPIDRGSVRGAKVWAVELKKHLAEQLRNLIAPHLLRRTKVGAGLLREEGVGGSVSEDDSAPLCDGSVDDDEAVGTDGQSKRLPPKKETIIWLHPSEEQLGAYHKILEKSEVVREAAQKQKLGIEVFRAIGLLKRLCNHPMCLLPTPKPGAWADLLSECTADVEAEAQEQAVVPAEMPDENLAVGTAPNGSNVATDDARAGRAAEMYLRKLPRSADAIRAQSAKLRCLSSLLPELAARGHRILVFSQSLKMLDLIQICCLRPNKLRCLRIDGQTDAMVRAEKVAKFQGQPDRFSCMLLTTNVGGVGLNLTSADRVIMVDPAWNPATDAQAVDRAFRIGQTKEVRVYRLIMSGLIEDKMFRLQVFKMGLTKTALESGQQHRYFTAREIRALFEFTDPAVGETRKMLIDKHGEDYDSDIQVAAAEDGSKEGWAAAGPAVGLSDFASVYGCVEGEEEQDMECEAQVKEAKFKLGSADEKLQRMTEARQAAEAESERVQAELRDAMGKTDQIRDRLSKSDEAVKEKRKEMAQARRTETVSQARLDKATRWKSSAQEDVMTKRNAKEEATRILSNSVRAVDDASAQASAAEETFLKSVAEAASLLAIVDENGYAVDGGVVDAEPGKLHRAQKAMEKIRSCLDAAATRQCELDEIETELEQVDEGLADAQLAIAKFCDNQEETDMDPEARAAKRTAETSLKGREKDKPRLEQTRGKAQAKAESAREAVTASTQAFTEAGVAFAESFCKCEARPVKTDKFKDAVSNAKAAFRQVSSMLKSAKTARESWAKSLSARRKLGQKATAANVSLVEAEVWLCRAEEEASEASTEDKQQCSQRSAAEAELMAAEKAKLEAESEDLENKKQKESLKAAKPQAIEAVKAARAAEKEATQERQSLHAQCSKVEKEHLQLESAKNSAVQNLQDEVYDANQVEQAYEKMKSSSK